MALDKQVRRGRCAWRVAATMAAIALLASPAGSHAYTLVMSTGARLELLAVPQFVGGKALVETVDGRRLVVSWSAVSWSSTETVNKGLTVARPAAGAPAPRVWTNADLERLRGAHLNVAAPTTSPAPEAATAATSQPAATPDEAAWRSRAADLARAQADMEARAAELERLDEQWESLVLATGGAYANAAARELGDIRSERARIERELRQVRGERSRLDDEARKAGVPPGWLR
jgi:hypothetical protein